ncbi:MAG: exopolyphosphatase [Methanoregulaceae archaeon PtaB.Bin152]|nr:MAG: exopolyphosphatase [Methanoregulaceae archaeon PtaB.Bin152]
MTASLPYPKGGPGAGTHGGGRVVAFFDIGTNSIRLLVVCLHRDCTYHVLTRQKEVVRLGEGEFDDHCIRESAIERAVVVCQRFIDLAHSFGVEEYVAVATSATREAMNKNDLLHRLRQEARLDVRIISGEEEARLIYLGVAGNMHLGDERAVFIDIGGGSTEIIVGGQHTYEVLASLPLGAIRLTNQFFARGFDGSVSKKRYESICRSVNDVIARELSRFPVTIPGRAIGSSGTIINLAEIASRTSNGSRSSGPEVLDRKSLSRVISLLCSLPLKERRNVPGINPDRGDIIIAGAAVLDCLMEALSIERIEITGRGLQDGLLADYLTRMEGFPLLGQLTVRDRSVLQFARSCGVNEFHARTVAKIALELFDSAGKAGLHGFGPEERELLLYATFLHDVGSFISYQDHQVHSHYLISNSDLPGFSRKEALIMATIARFHRKKAPGKQELSSTGLDPADQKKARALVALLRMAESLDRSHAALVRHAAFQGTTGKNAILVISAVGDCQLELWGIEHEAGNFRRIFGRRLVTEVRRAELGEIHELDGESLPHLLNHSIPREWHPGESRKDEECKTISPRARDATAAGRLNKGDSR